MDCVYYVLQFCIRMRIDKELFRRTSEMVESKLLGNSRRCTKAATRADSIFTIGQIHESLTTTSAQIEYVPISNQHYYLSHMVRG